MAVAIDLLPSAVPKVAVRMEESERPAPADGGGFAALAAPSPTNPYLQHKTPFTPPSYGLWDALQAVWHLGHGMGRTFTGCVWLPAQVQDPGGWEEPVLHRLTRLMAGSMMGLVQIF